MEDNTSMPRLAFFLLLPVLSFGFQAPPVQLTTPEDHKRMMDLLRISSLRQGADGRNAQAPNAANYDEAKANPFPKLPDPLVLKNGKKVKNAAAWWKRRRFLSEHARRNTVDQHR